MTSSAAGASFSSASSRSPSGRCGAACPAAKSLLVIDRFVQGADAAATAAVLLGMIVHLFPEPDKRAKAIGAYAAVASAGGALGLLLGGVLTQALSWHWIFLVNLPIGVVGFLLTLRYVPEDGDSAAVLEVDFPGAVLLVASLMIAVFAIVQTGQCGWGSAHTIGFGALAVALMSAFVARQATARTPLVPLRIFTPERSPRRYASRPRSRRRCRTGCR